MISTNESNNDQSLDSCKAFQKLETTTVSTNTKATQSKWGLVRKVATTRGRRQSSLTLAEESFLKLLKESKDKEQRDDPSTTMSNNNNNNKNDTSTFVSKSIDTLYDAVEVVIVRESLRKSISSRIPFLSGPEAIFLTNLVNNEDATPEQLAQAEKVLTTDPLYRTKEEEDAIQKDAAVASNKEENISPVVENREMISKIRCHSIKPKNSRNDDCFCEDDNNVEVVFRQSCMYAFDLGEIEKELYGIDLSQPAKFSRSSWKALGRTPSEYLILGTNANDSSVQPHVLSPAIMDSLRSFLPLAVSHDNFWLKYSMNRDGASLQAMYNQVRNTTRSILAIETDMGEVFGAYVSSPWRNNSNFYGSCESFVWRLSSSRFMPTSSIEEQIELESSLDVFSWSKENRNIQISTDKKLIIGGGKSDLNDSDEDQDQWGMSIALNEDLFTGTSSPCLTYRSPSLTNQNDDGVFEISNIEIWVRVREKEIF